MRALQGLIQIYVDHFGSFREKGSRPQWSSHAMRGLHSSARRSLDKLADPFLDGGGEPLQGKGGWPDVTVVEVCSVLETERRVSRLELLPALKEADNLAFLGICGHPVPGFR